jgi:hypothetical protein
MVTQRIQSADKVYDKPPQLVRCLHIPIPFESSRFENGLGKFFAQEVDLLLR